MKMELQNRRRDSDIVEQKKVVQCYRSKLETFTRTKVILKAEFLLKILFIGSKS